MGVAAGATALSVLACFPLLTKYDADAAFAFDRVDRDEEYRYHNRITQSFILLTSRRLRVWQNLRLAGPSVAAAEATATLTEGRFSEVRAYKLEPGNLVLTLKVAATSESTSKMGRMGKMAKRKGSGAAVGAEIRFALPDDECRRLNLRLMQCFG